MEITEKLERTTKVMFCSCSHEYQDKTYGINMRVFNKVSTTTGHPKKYRCTICGKEKE